jgi:hypothetical protein
MLSVNHTRFGYPLRVDTRVDKCCESHRFIREKDPNFGYKRTSDLQHLPLPSTTRELQLVVHTSSILRSFDTYKPLSTGVLSLGWYP